MRLAKNLPLIAAIHHCRERGLSEGEIRLAFRADTSEPITLLAARLSAEHQKYARGRTRQKKKDNLKDAHKDAAPVINKRVISPQVIRWLAQEMLVRCGERRWPPPPQLVTLVGELLRTGPSAVKGPSAELRLYPDVAYYCADQPGPPWQDFRKIAAHFGNVVSFVTIREWLQRPTFAEDVAEIRAAHRTGH